MTRPRSPTWPVEIVTNCKYLGTIIDNKLDWSPNTDAYCKNVNQRMYLLRKLEKFQVDKKSWLASKTDKQTIIQSAMLYNQECYFGSSKKADTERLVKVARTAAKTVRRRQQRQVPSTEVLL